MKKLYLIHFVFLAMAVIAMIPLTFEVFGNLNVDVIRLSAVIAFIGVVGNSICVLIRVCKNKK